eukprot:scaffold17246_cov72-Skeletonema_dohrnii-CCMP3373.AAC.1
MDTAFLQAETTPFGENERKGGFAAHANLHPTVETTPTASDLAKAIATSVVNARTEKLQLPIQPTEIAPFIYSFLTSR